MDGQHLCPMVSIKIELLDFISIHVGGILDLDIPCPVIFFPKSK